MTISSAPSAALLPALTDAVSEAGRLALSMFRKDVRTWNKENQSPVTEADLAVDLFLRKRLFEADLDAGWLSEETADAPARLEKSRIWIVDPIDGTRSFVAGKEDWAVCAALVEEGRPVLGAVFVPATGELFAAALGNGATRNGTAISASEPRDVKTAAIARPYGLEKTFAQTGNMTSAPHIHAIAVRLARVASGEIDGALARENANDWDIAAADLIIHEAGGKLTDSAGNLPRYNRPVPKHGMLVASGKSLHAPLLAALATR